MRKAIFRLGLAGGCLAVALMGQGHTTAGCASSATEDACEDCCDSAFDTALTNCFKTRASLSCYSAAFNAFESCLTPCSTLPHPGHCTR